MQKHLTGLANLTRDEIETFLEKPGHGVALAGGPVALLFYEPSTRTKASFEIAARRCDMDVLHFNPETSSEQKGETFLDTARNLAWMGCRALVVRTPHIDVPRMMAEVVDIPVINAGNGTGEHPTQALGDAVTLLEHFGSLEGLKVAIVGDIAHSRVARSNAHLFKKFGARVHLVSEDCDVDIPRDLATSSYEEGFAGVDAVMVLRTQFERYERTPRLCIYPPLEEATIKAHAAAHAVVMHPGPICRLEVASGLIDGPRSLIARQVQNGVRVRHRVLEVLVMEREYGA